MAAETPQQEMYSDLGSTSGQELGSSTVIESSPSKPFTSVNVPEPIIDFEQTGFVYNYFTPDERMPITE